MRLLLPSLVLVAGLAAQSPAELFETMRTADDRVVALRAAVELQRRGEECLPLMMDFVQGWLTSDGDASSYFELPLLSLLPHSAAEAERLLSGLIEDGLDGEEDVARAVRLLDFLRRTARSSPSLSKLLVICAGSDKPQVAALGASAAYRLAPDSSWAQEQAPLLAAGPALGKRLWAVHVLRHQEDSPWRTELLERLARNSSILVKYSAGLQLDKKRFLRRAKHRALRQPRFALRSRQNPEWQRAWECLAEWVLEQGDPFLTALVLEGLVQGAAPMATIPERLRRQLAERAGQGSENATVALAMGGLRSVHYLVNLIARAEPARRRAIAKAAAQYRLHAAFFFPYLMHHAETEKPEDRWMALEFAAVGGVDDPVLDGWFLGFLASTERSTRRRAAELLARLPGIAARQSSRLWALAETLDPRTGSLIVSVLVKTGLLPEIATEKLRLFLHAEDTEVVLATLGVIRDLQPNDELRKELERIAKRGKNIARARAVEILIEWSVDDETIDILVLSFLADDNLAFLGIVYFAERGRDDLEVVEKLLPFLTSHRHRDNARTALQRMPDSLSKVIPQLTALLEQDKVHRRTVEAVFQLLESMGTDGQPATPAIRKFAATASDRVRKRATEVLKSIEGK